MARHLQISLLLNTDSDPEPEVNVTPVDAPIPTQAANAIETGIMLSDLSDAVPGSGKFEVDTRIKLPVKIFGFTFMVNYPVRVVVDTVEKG